MNLMELASLFGCKYDDLFFKHLKSISVPNKTVCGKEIKEGDGGWNCKDCELESNSIYCNDCFIQEKHINHEVYYHPNASGCCDCGISKTLKPEGFCNNHKGDFINMKELMNFIMSSIDENLLNNINNIFNNIFLAFIDKIKNLVDGTNEEEKNELYKMFDYLEIFCQKLYENNKSLFYFFILKFTENYPYETRHKCFNYDEENNLVTYIKKDKNKKHICICPFMQVIIYVLMQRKTKQNSLSFFNLFLQTYKIKIVISLCYLYSFSELFNNENLDSFRLLGVQLINENLGQLVYQEQNIPFLEFCFEEIYNICYSFMKEKQYDKLELIYPKFYQLVNDIPNMAIIDKINSNVKIIKIIINICCLINYTNIFENNKKIKEFQNEGFEGRLINVETYSIFTIISLLHVINFDDDMVVKSIFDIIFEKLIEYKKYKESLTIKKYTPHLTTIKCSSLFLNRYCFNYSIKYDYDLYNSFIHFMNIYPKSKKLNEFIFKELILFFGFMTSQLYEFFTHFKDMENYHKIYFNHKFIFIKCDITLFQYLLIQPEIKEQFNIQNISMLSDIKASNQNFLKLFNKDLNINNFYSEPKNFQYINSLIEFLYLMIRDNTSMEKMAFRNVDMKLKDEINEKLYKKEKDKIHNIVKNDIIHFILGNDNSVTREVCLEYLKKNYDSKYKSIVDDILKNYCQKKVFTHGLNKFSLKKEIVKLFDLDYIISFQNRQNAFQYMSNFMIKEFDSSNFHIIEPLKMKQKFTKYLYQSFYNDKNIDQLIKLYNLIYINEEVKSLQIFQDNLTKILYFAFKICSTELFEEDFQQKLLEKMNQMQDKNLMNKINNEVKGKKQQEILKSKYKKKNYELLKKYGFSETNVEETFSSSPEKEDICAFCRQSLYKNKHKLDNFFGKIYYCFSDSSIDILKKKPKDKIKQTKKFVSCDHSIHYQCISFPSDPYKQDFECPSCKTLSNIIIFDFSFIVDNNYDMIQALESMDEKKIDFYEFYKPNPGNEFEGLFFSNYNTFESYCSKLYGKQIKIENFSADDNLLEKTLKLIADDFEIFTIYYTMTSQKQEQIETWKNILYNIRFLFQYKILKIPDTILNSDGNIFKIDSVEIFEQYLMNYDFSDIINKFIIISFIFFDSNDENWEKIRNIFINKILIYFIYIAFIQSNEKDIDYFFNNNKSEIQKAIELCSLKYKICLLLFDEEEEYLNINIPIESLILFLKSNSDFLYLIKSKNNENNLLHIKSQYMEIPKFKIINLPEKGLQFLNEYNGDCFYCHKKGTYLYLCLICGGRICYNMKCLVHIDKEKEYSLVDHTLKCCGGNGLFLNMKNAEIMYILGRRVIESKFFIYFNEYGEILKDKYLSDDYTLNKENLNEGIKKYIDMTYRKKSKDIFIKSLLNNALFLKEMNK